MLVDLRLLRIPPGLVKVSIAVVVMQLKVVDVHRREFVGGELTMIGSKKLRRPLLIVHGVEGGGGGMEGHAG